MGSHVRSVARRCLGTRGCERVRESPDGAGFHSHDTAGRPQSHRAHSRRIAAGPHVGEAVQGGGYPSCEHREERGGRGSLEGHWRRVCRELVSPIVQRRLAGSRESHRGHNRVRRDGGGTLAMDILTAFDTSLRQLYPDQVHPAYGPAMVRTVYKYGGLDRRNSEFLPSVGVGNWSWAGWLMPFHFAKYGEEHRAASIKKAVAGVKTTFSTSFGTNLSLEDLAKSPEEYLATLQSQTDKKFVVLPNGPL